jgi:hypothetical protein
MERHPIESDGSGWVTCPKLNNLTIETGLTGSIFRSALPAR